MSDSDGVRDLIAHLDDRILLERLDGKLNVIIAQLAPVQTDVTDLKDRVTVLEDAYSQQKGAALVLRVLWAIMAVAVGAAVSLFTFGGKP